MEDILYLVAPCYNEEEILMTTAERLLKKIEDLTTAGKISLESKIVFVDDGSRDRTWDIIEGLCENNHAYIGIKLSRNRGHQNALFAGLMAVKEEAGMVISIDADLQDDIEAIDKMVDEYLNGCDIVYGVREDRKIDSFFKRATAHGYYRLLSSLGCDILFDHADYRLMSSRALEALSEYGEQRLFLRGLVPMLGYKTSIVRYTRLEREAGESKYPLKRMLMLALDGLMSLSLRPLRAITAVGAFMLAIAAALLIYLVVSLFMGQELFGWKAATFSVWAVGGIVTLSIGIVGEYVGRAYHETKHRPRYFIEKAMGLKKHSPNNTDESI